MDDLEAILEVDCSRGNVMPIQWLFRWDVAACVKVGFLYRVVPSRNVTCTIYDEIEMRVWNTQE